MSEARFTDDEARRILDAAATRQEASDGSALPVSSTFSISDLEAIAAEVGIDAEHVRAAALTVRRGSDHAAAPAGSGDRVIAVRRSVAAELSDREWERIVHELRTTFGKTGVATQYGEVREWISTTNDGEIPVHVRIAPGEGGVEIEIRRDPKVLRDLYRIFPAAFGLLAVLLAALFLIGDFPQATWALPALFAGVGGALGGGSWLYARRWEAAQGERLRGVVDRMELIAVGSDDPRGPPP